MPTLFLNRSYETIRTYGLVLTACGIAHRIRPRGHRWSVDVPTPYRSAACDAIAKYLQENPTETSHSRNDTPLKLKTTFSAFYVVAPLVLIHWRIAPGDEMQAMVAGYGADADHIINGELFRCVTALMLHASWAHLMGNVVALLIFGTAFSALVGWGVGWLLVLLCGSAGNFLTALWYGQGHVSIGASTAVFTAVGLCAALSFWRGRRIRSWSWRQWTPLASGLALLGFLGSAPHTDLVAHVMGFVSGLATGLIYGWQPRLARWPIQLAAAMLTISVVILSWIWGLDYSG